MKYNNSKMSKIGSWEDIFRIRHYELTFKKQFILHLTLNDPVTS